MKNLNFKILGIEHIGIATNNKNYNQLYEVFKKIMNLDYIGKEEISDQQTITTIFDTRLGKIELLKGMSPDSVIDKFIEKKGFGVHHIAFKVKNLKSLISHLKKNNIKLIYEQPQIGADGYFITFIHPKSTPGVLIELCEK